MNKRNIIIIIIDLLVFEHKLLGVMISDDLKWNTHIKYVIAKAAKRLYALRFKCEGDMPEDMLKLYTCNIRLILEYAVQVWRYSCIPF